MRAIVLGKRSLAALARRSIGLSALGLIFCASAHADVFGPISLVSASPFQQVEYAHDPVISGDGRYVVFDGAIGGVRGVWRRENTPGGSLVQVAGGPAQLPSISANGQYVSFTTNEGRELAEVTNGRPSPPHETHEAPNVYVRDLGVADPSQPGAFTLASPLSYEYSAGTSAEFEREHFGAEAAGRTALSADGGKVVFVTTAASDLAGPGTPALQVAVHDLHTGTTQLVSVKDDPATGKPATEAGRALPVPLIRQGGSGPAQGAAYTAGGPPPFESPAPAGASISADGTTVAWMAQNIGAQVRGLSGEAFQPEYSEPLWRRIADGEQSPTRRVTGGSDPADPQCAAHPESTLPPFPSASDPCQGPFAPSPQYGIWTGATNVPQLSADGYMLAFIANAPLLALGEGFGIGAGPGHPSDAYLADMHEGLTRAHALRALTELAGGDIAQVATDAPILDIAISADGQQISFTTMRTVFPLGSPVYVSPPAAVPGLAELFDVDLANDTLTRVTRSYEAGASERSHGESQKEDPYREGDGALSPSMSADGRILAFSSTASNLVYGDGNTPPANDWESTPACNACSSADGSDAFVLRRSVFTPAPAPQAISPEPPEPTPSPLWSLGVTARSLADGRVQLDVAIPGAGTLSVSASSLVRVRLGGVARHGGHGAVRKRTSKRTAVLARVVASSKRVITAADGGIDTLLLVLTPHYKALATQSGGLSATASLTFSASGHPTLRQRVALTFVRKAPPHRRGQIARAHPAGPRS